MGNHIKSHSQSRRPQPSLQLLIQFDFGLNSISAILKKKLSGPVGRPDLKLFARVIRAKHAGPLQAKVCLPSLERLIIFCSQLYWVIVFSLPFCF